MDVDRVGARIGPRLARIVADAAVYARMRTGPHTTRLAVHAANRFLEQVTDEHQTTMAGLWEQLEATGELPPWAANAFGFLARGQGQWSALLGHAVTSAGVGQGILPLLTNALNPAIGGIISLDPNGFIDPGTSAQIVARRLVDRHTGQREASFSGINPARFGNLVDLAMAPPSPDVILEMLRRGIISGGDAQHGIEHNGVETDWIPRILALRDVLAAPADLASMVVRGIKTEADAAHVAGRSGIPAGDFADMVELSGEPPGLEQLLFLRRRGKIDRARLERGIRQSRVRTEWTDAVEALATVPMSTDAAVGAVVQGHLSDAAGKQIAVENGLEPAQWQTLVDTAGEPISRTEALELLNRGEMSEAQVVQAIRESRVKNKYIVDILKLRRRLPQADAVGTAFRHGVITEAAAIALVEHIGYSAADAKMVVDAHKAAAKAPVKERHRALSEAFIRTAYLERMMTRAEATRLLVKLTYTPADAAELLDLADAEHAHTEAMAEAAVHRQHFLAHRITAEAARAKLAAAGLDHTVITHLLTVWERELLAAPKVLTAAQLATAAAHGFIPGQEALARLEQQGYAQRDAVIFLLLHKVDPKGLPTGGLTLPPPPPKP